MEPMEMLTKCRTEIVALIQSLEPLRQARATAEARYDRQLGNTCKELKGSMPVGLIEKVAKAACSDLKEEVINAVEEHKDAKIAQNAWIAVGNMCQTEINQQKAERMLT